MNPQALELAEPVAAFAPVCETCRGLRALYLPDGRTVVPCRCVPDEDRWRASAIPSRFFAAPLSPLPSDEIPRSRLFYGKPGRGKTRAAVGVLKRFSRARHGGLFADLVTLEGERRAAVKTGEELPGAEYFACPFLVADDVCRNRRHTDFWVEFIEDLVRHRYNAQLPTVWTSNFSLEVIGEVLGSWVSGRIAEMSAGRVHEMTGRDWRAG